MSKGEKRFQESRCENKLTEFRPASKHRVPLPSFQRQSDHLNFFFIDVGTLKSVFLIPDLFLSPETLSHKGSEICRKMEEKKAASVIHQSASSAHCPGFRLGDISAAVRVEQGTDGTGCWRAGGRQISAWREGRPRSGGASVDGAR